MTLDLTFKVSGGARGENACCFILLVSNCVIAKNGLLLSIYWVKSFSYCVDICTLLVSPTSASILSSKLPYLSRVTV